MKDDVRPTLAQHQKMDLGVSTSARNWLMMKLFALVHGIGLFHAKIGPMRCAGRPSLLKSITQISLTQKIMSLFYDCISIFKYINWQSIYTKLDFIFVISRIVLNDLDAHITPSFSIPPPSTSDEYQIEFFILFHFIFIHNFSHTQNIKSPD